VERRDEQQRLEGAADWRVVDKVRGFDGPDHLEVHSSEEETTEPYER
jgi:hypothetical protein